MPTNRYFQIIDKEGKGRNDVPEFEDALKEIIRSHDLSLKISAKHPTDEDFHVNYYRFISALSKGIGYAKKRRDLRRFFVDASWSQA